MSEPEGRAIADALRRVSNREAFKYVNIDWTALGAALVGEYVAAPVEHADIPLETYWSDRTAALAEALHETVCDNWNLVHAPGGDDGDAKDALLYLREHGWTLEREER